MVEGEKKKKHTHTHSIKLTRSLLQIALLRTASSLFFFFKTKDIFTFALLIAAGSVFSTFFLSSLLVAFRVFFFLIVFCFISLDYFGTATKKKKQKKKEKGAESL